MIADYAPAILRRITLVRASQGERIPTGYGLAWIEPSRDVAVFVPIPFNLIVQVCRWLYYSTAHARILNAMDRAEDAGYQLGHRHGHESATRSCDERMKILAEHLQRSGR
jgi:hypothetical protein